MDIITTNAEKSLIKITSSLTQDPQSWNNWFCLKIDLENCNTSAQEPSMRLIRSIIDTHLKDVQGESYFCTNAVHILCKPPSDKVLEQTGVQICDLISTESSDKATYTLYDLRKDSAEYVQSIIGTTDNIFTLPASSANTHKNEEADTEERNIPYKEPSSQPHIQKNKTLSSHNAPRVLLVEDDPITRWMVRNSLKDVCDFATAPTASKAYAMYTSYQPDVVFLDINLPDNNGRCVLEWIKEHDPGACVVMFSSNGSLDNITECLNDGASGFITKPFLKEDLLHYVQHRTR